MRAMKTLMLAGALVAWGGGATFATEYEPDEGTEGHVPAVTYEVYLLQPGEGIDPALMQADLEYTKMMAQHHEGALTMSKDYLGDPRGSSPIARELAHAIIANQRFEIGVLDRIRQSTQSPPQAILDLGFVRVVGRETGVDGVEHLERFVRRLPPGPLDFALTAGGEASEFDVAFAKGMILHHQAAVDMARAYNADPLAQNPVIRPMNLDIIVDQNYEIGVLERLIDRFPGDPEAVEPVPAAGMPMDHAHH
jgi:uncharacterized protein (DUF305 family)